MTEPTQSRRAALLTIGGATLAVCLAGCAPSGGAAAGSAGSVDPKALKTADIPVGGGRIVGEYVVTQPKAGEFEAFSYLCSHQNLPVQQVSDAAIICGRHGSTFSLADGSVLTGPATKGLTAVKVTVSGDALRIG